MKKHLITSLLTASIIASSGIGALAQNYNYDRPQLQGKVTLIPMGTTISGVTTCDLSSETLAVGDSVALTLAAPFYYKGTLIAPVNSNVIGLVTMSQAAGRGDRTGKLKIKFKEIITPNGQSIPISAKVITNDGTGLLMGTATKEKMKEMGKNIAIGTAAGALSGTIFGPISGGKVGKGAALGTAVGAGLGLGKTLIDKGAPVYIPTGSQINIMIDQPVTVNY